MASNTLTLAADASRVVSRPGVGGGPGMNVAAAGASTSGPAGCGEDTAAVRADKVVRSRASASDGAGAGGVVVAVDCGTVDGETVDGSAAPAAAWAREPRNACRRSSGEVAGDMANPSRVRVWGFGRLAGGRVAVLPCCACGPLGRSAVSPAARSACGHAGRSFFVFSRAVASAGNGPRSGMFWNTGNPLPQWMRLNCRY